MIKLVLDADALNLLSENRELFEKIKNRSVLTPHLVEFSRLSGFSPEEINKNKFEIVKDFAQKYKIKYEVAVGEGNFLFEKAMGGIKGLPASALFKANGDYVQGYIGLVPEEMLENDINRATK